MRRPANNDANAGFTGGVPSSDRKDQAYSPFMRALLLLAALVGTGSTTAAAQALSFREMRWRDIGPTRAGRARALAGVASQPNTFYAGFDNGGLWPSTDSGSNLVSPLD